MNVIDGKHLRSTEYDEATGAWTVCSVCWGHMIYMDGERIADCYCRGGSERARDSKGRFTNPFLTAKFQSGKM